MNPIGNVLNCENFTSVFENTQNMS